MGARPDLPLGKPSGSGVTPSVSPGTLRMSLRLAPWSLGWTGRAGMRVAASCRPSGTVGSPGRITQVDVDAEVPAGQPPTSVHLTRTR